MNRPVKIQLLSSMEGRAFGIKKPYTLKEGTYRTTFSNH